MTGTYVLTDSQSGVSYNLIGANDKLRTHVGEEIQVRGQPASGTVGTSASSSSLGANPSPEAGSGAQGGVSSTNPNNSAGSVSGTGTSGAANSGNAGSTNQTGSAAPQTFQVTDVTKVADHCTAQGARPSASLGNHYASAGLMAASMEPQQTGTGTGSNTSSAGQTGTSATFTPDGGVGMYSFRGRLRRSNRKHSGWSPKASISAS